MSNIVIVIPDEMFVESGMEKLWKKHGFPKEWLYGRGASGLTWKQFYERNISGHVRDDISDNVLG